MKVVPSGSLGVLSAFTHVPRSRRRHSAATMPSLTANHQLAWDVGAGNGQASVSVRSSLNCKIVYIARNPRDSFVSLWKFYNRLTGQGSLYLEGDLNKETVFDAFCSGFYYGCPFAESVLSYWHESRCNLNKVMLVTSSKLHGLH